MICGRCKIGNQISIGANATIIDKISIEDENIIGAGSVIIQDIVTKGKTYVEYLGKLYDICFISWNKNQPAWKTCVDLYNHGINNIELSGGCYDADQLTNLKKFKNKINFQIHNYFPPPAEPFVFNLASLSPDIIKRSLDHVETALQFSLELDCQRYSFHAGFLIDPQVSELGRSKKKRII